MSEQTKSSCFYQFYSIKWEKNHKKNQESHRTLVLEKGHLEKTEGSWGKNIRVQHHSVSPWREHCLSEIKLF